ncbi:hypothetical protein [Enterococcus faecium]|uniref:hypothetical protein n=1 Tax=Enterococcus TaxID=1350 RepID=UPI0028806A73|nr:hypothetical protein [Enterococcus faecium]
MKKTYQKFLWISYIALFIVGFFVSVSVIVGTLFLLFSDEDLLLKGLMSTLSCVMLLYLCIQINEIMPPHWQEKKKEFKEEIEMKSDDWIEHTWLPLKRNSKRKEFWVLQLWALGNLCSYVVRLVFDLIIYSIGIFGTAYYLINDHNRIAAADIFTVLMTLIFVMLLSIFTQLVMQFTRQKLTTGKLFKSLFDFIIVNAILASLIKQIEQSGRTTKGVKEFLMTFVHFVNGHMYLFEVGIILFLVGYVSTKLIKRSIEKEIEIDLIPTLLGYEYYVDFGRYDELINTDIVHMSIHESTVKGIRSILKDGQEMKAIDRRKEVYNFYEVEASLRYGIGKLWLDGSNIRQNKPYIFWNSSDLELPIKDK